MKINKQILAISLVVSSMTFCGQAFADSHSNKQEDKSSTKTSTMEQTENNFSSSVKYGKNRDVKSNYRARASDLIGQTIESPNGDNIGEIDDIVFSGTDNKIMAIISVGGFLGLGEKFVAVPYKDLRVSRDGDRVYLDTTEEALKSEAEFTYNKGETSGQMMRDARMKMAADNRRKTYDNSVMYDNKRGNKSVYHVRASQLIGETVEQRDGDNIGEIDDLVYSNVDKKLLAVVSVGGFLGMGEKLVTVPYNELRVSDGGDDVFLNSSSEKLKAQTEFKYNDGETTGKQMRMSRNNAESSDRESKFADSVEYGKNRDAQSQYQIRISEIIDETVESPNGDNIGEIDDVVYSRTDQKLMAIISVGGFLGIGEKLVAVPYDKLRVSADGDDVYLDSTKDALKAMATFTYSDDE